MRGVTAVLVLPVMFVLLHNPVFNSVTWLERVSCGFKSLIVLFAASLLMGKLLPRTGLLVERVGDWFSE